MGYLKDDKKNGQGTYTSASGDKYVGKFNDEKYNGQGTYTTADGNKYVGEFKDDKLSGQGTYTFANGRKEIGEFSEDKLNGKAIIYSENGLFLESGIYKDDVLIESQYIDPNSFSRIAKSPVRYEKSYFQLEKELMTNITGSKKVMVVQIAVMTHYDSRVFDNIKKHEFALRYAMLDVMRRTTEAEASKTEFRKELAVKLKDVMNSLLEDYEDFGGVEEVMFTSFIMQ